jgi:hypothetical protein
MMFGIAVDSIFVVFMFYQLGLLLSKDKAKQKLEETRLLTTFLFLIVLVIFGVITDIAVHFDVISEPFGANKQWYEFLGILGELHFVANIVNFRQEKVAQNRKVSNGQ